MVNKKIYYIHYTYILRMHATQKIEIKKQAKKE